MKRNLEKMLFTCFTMLLVISGCLFFADTKVYAEVENGHINLAEVDMSYHLSAPGRSNGVPVNIEAEEAEACRFVYVDIPTIKGAPYDVYCTFFGDGKEAGSGVLGELYPVDIEGNYTINPSTPPSVAKYHKVSDGQNIRLVYKLYTNRYSSYSYEIFYETGLGVWNHNVDENITDTEIVTCTGADPITITVGAASGHDAEIIYDWYLESYKEVDYINDYQDADHWQPGENHYINKHLGIVHGKDGSLRVDSFTLDKFYAPGVYYYEVSISCKNPDTGLVERDSKRYEVWVNGEEIKQDQTNDSSGGDDGTIDENGNKLVQEITINLPSNKLAAGCKVKLSATVLPNDATNKSIKWTVSNKKYASISSNGLLTIKKAAAGKTFWVTAQSKEEGNSVLHSAKIFVQKNKVTGISLKANKTIKAGKSLTIKANVSTNGKKANKQLIYQSSNTKYATVNKNGKVTAKAAGKGKTVTITAKATDGSGKKASIKIKIK